MRVTEVLSGTGRNPELRKQESPLSILCGFRMKRDLCFLGAATKILLPLKESRRAHFTLMSLPQ